MLILFKRFYVDMIIVPGEGIEPSWSISPTDFKSVASTNSATPARS